MHDVAHDEPPDGDFDLLVEDYDVGRGTMSGMSARPGRLAA